MQGKGRLYIDGKDIGEVQFELNMAVRKQRHPENPEHIFHDSREAAEEYHRKNGGCLNWCKCGLWICTGKEGHGGPFHFFKEHPCKDLQDPMAALLAAEEVVETDPLLDSHLTRAVHRSMQKGR